MIVLDSSFLIAYHNERDGHHAAARSVMEDFLAERWGTGLLLEYVLLEVVTVLLIRRNLSVAAEVGRNLLDAKELEFIPCSDLFLDTFETFTSQAATQLSFTDTAIAAVARSRADGLIASFDREFRKVPDCGPFRNSIGFCTDL